MKNEEEIKRLFQIKLSVLKRCIKEHAAYEAEVANQKTYIQKLLIDSPQNAESEHVINKQRQVLAESLRMLPECHGRIEQAKAVLRDFLKQNSELSLVDREEAEKVLS
jgi:hypothetical protein